MLRALSIRNFVVVESLDLEFDAGFTVLTGETGAGKSILLDALALLLGDRFEARQLRPAPRAPSWPRCSTSARRPRSRAGSQSRSSTRRRRELLLRRALDAQGRSRAWINGRPATLAQLRQLGERAASTCTASMRTRRWRGAEAQRTLLDAFGGFAALAREVAEAWRAWRAAARARATGAASAAQAHRRRARTLLERAARARRARRSAPPNGPSSPRRSRASPTPRR